jgi:hypothetical protein
MKKDNELLTLTDEQIKIIAKAIDKGFDAEKVFKSTIMGKVGEALDGPLIKTAITQTNKLASPYIPDEWKDEIQAAVDDCFDGDKDYTTSVEKVFAIIDTIVEGEIEKEWVKTIIISFLNLVKTGLLIYLEDKLSDSE